MKITDDLSHAETIVLGGRQTRRLTPEERECVRRIRERALHARCTQRVKARRRPPIRCRWRARSIGIPTANVRRGVAALFAILLMILILML